MNKELYNELKSNQRGEISKDSWFIASAQTFLNQPLENKEDVIRLIAFVYSWMPTIPSLHEENVNYKLILKNLKRLRANEEFELDETLKNLIPLTNNSIVGASKVLFFVNPKVVPIIDSRVVSCWNRKIAVGDNLDKKIKDINDKNINKKIEEYKKYWKNLKMWIVNCENKISIREIESSLYEYDLKLP